MEKNWGAPAARYDNEAILDYMALTGTSGKNNEKNFPDCQPIESQKVINQSGFSHLFSEWIGTQQ